MRHSTRLMYLASISPTPAWSIWRGAWQRISRSPMMAQAKVLSSDTFSPSHSMEEVAEA